jgi:hypothetical protein
MDAGSSWHPKRIARAITSGSMRIPQQHQPHSQPPSPPPPFPQVFNIMRQAVAAGVSSPAARNASGIMQCLPCYCRGLGTSLAQLGGEALISTKWECSTYLNTLDANVIMIRFVHDQVHDQVRTLGKWCGCWMQRSRPAQQPQEPQALCWGGHEPACMHACMCIS